MPIYEFICTKCSAKTEKLVPVEDRDKPIKCEECKTDTYRTVSLPSPAQFKGTGWTPKNY